MQQEALYGNTQTPDPLLNVQGLLEGLEVFTKNVQDTRIIAYLATNSTAGNVLGLKPLAHEFAGNWAVEEIKDIRKVPLKDLLQYNLVDCLSTNYVKDKYYPIMVQDQQEELYYSLMLPSLKVIIQMELTGMSMDAKKIQEAKKELEEQQQEYLSVIRNSSIIKVFDLLVQRTAMDKANAKLKTKQHPIEKYKDVVFNPNSGPQLKQLLYEQMCLPVLDYTDTKQPATGGDTLEKLINHTTNQAYKDILTALIGLSKVDKILTSFIPAFEKAIFKVDGKVYLHGSFNLGGCVSGRLSSSRPNLQQIPSNSIYAKLIKKCFSVSPGWIFVGADFTALESKIDTLLTKDPMKEVVFTDGFDSHCLASYFYFTDQMPDISKELNGYFDDSILIKTIPKELAVKTINSIKGRYPELRQASKSISFASLYGGTYQTLMNNCGLTEASAKSVEANYHKLYKVSDAWKEQRLKQASIDGYASVAFGLRVRTPLLKQVIWGASRMPYEAAAEGRTVGNALGQSFCMLNNRAANDFMQKVWSSKHRLSIKPVALIHDAIYLQIRDDIEVLDWVNRELVKSMEWQELPEIQHPTVKLGAELDCFWPDWSNPITIPNNADQDTIRSICSKAKEKYETK